jgi:uncharacterized protein (DUF927 family)
MRDIAGFRRKEGERWAYYVTPEGWTGEVCSGFDSKALADALIARNMLVGATSRHRAANVIVPGHGKRRLYHLPVAFLEASDE